MPICFGSEARSSQPQPFQDAYRRSYIIYLYDNMPPNHHSNWLYLDPKSCSQRLALASVSRSLPWKENDIPTK